MHYIKIGEDYINLAQVTQVIYIPETATYRLYFNCLIDGMQDVYNVTGEDIGALREKMEHISTSDDHT